LRILLGGIFGEIYFEGSDFLEWWELLTGDDEVGYSFKARADLVKIQEVKLFANWLDKSIKNNNFV